MRARHEQVGIGWLAVVGVIIPAPAGRLVAVHEQVGLAAHLAVEILHPQLLAPLGPAVEAVMAADEAVVLNDHDRHIETVPPALELLAKPPFARFGQDDALVRPLRQRPLDRVGETGAGPGLVEPVIDHPPSRRFQFGREMAHGGEDQGDLLAVMPDIACFADRLDHQDIGLARRGLAQAREVGAQLVAQHQYQVGHHTFLHPVPVGLRRTGQDRPV